jgi:O-antigen/teichoic acid export membrane protein
MDVRRSLLLSFVEKYVTVGISFVSVVVIARLVTPDEIGLFSVAAAIINVAQMFRDFGVASFLLQEKQLTRDHLATALSIVLLSGCFFAILFAGLAIPIAGLYHDPRLAPVIACLSVNFILVSLASVSGTLLRRGMMFTAITRVGIAQSVANVSVSIGAVLLGFGPMGLAWGATAGMLANLIVGQLHLPKGTMPRPGLREWRRLLSYGVVASGAQLLVGLGQRLPDMVIGRLLGFAATGFYSRGSSFVTLFNDTIIHAIWPVSVSAMAALHRDDQDLRQPTLSSLTLLTCIAWPMLGVLGVLAPTVMLVAFGEQWNAAVPVARILCLATAIAVLTTLSFSLTSAIGNVRLHMRSQAVLLPLQFVLLLVAARFGLSEVAWVAVAIETVQAALYGRATLATVGASWGEAGLACRSSLAVTIVTVGPAFAAAWVHGFAATLGWAELAAIGAATLAAWLIGLAVFRHPLRLELSRLLRTLRAGLSPA